MKATQSCGELERMMASYSRTNLSYMGRGSAMVPNQSVQTHHIRLLPSQDYNVLVITQDLFFTETIQDAIQPLLRHVHIATNDEELHLALSQTRIYQLVIIDVPGIESLYDLIDAIKSAWPDSELILISEEMYSWTELIQRGAYEMLPKPVSSDDLVWAAVGALLKHAPAKAMRAAI